MNNLKVSSDITNKQLINYGFTYHYPDKFVYRIPCYKHKNKQPLLFLEFVILFDNEPKNKISNPTMLINCRDKNDNFYVPFYSDYYNKNEVLDKVNRKLSLIVADMINKRVIIKNNKPNSKRRK